MTCFVSHSADETFAFGVRIGGLLNPGDFLALFGELGAGKTQFVKGIAAGLGVNSDEPVVSPTYALLNIHHGRLTLYHFDLYRLTGEEQVDELGFQEYFAGNEICIVEWSERLGSLLPAESVSIRFSHNGEESRRIEIEHTGRRARELIQKYKEIV